jgi:hypothetical protein
MKKLITITLALLLIIGTAIPAHAVTPKMEIPKLPEVPELTPDFSFIDFGKIIEKWFEIHPVRVESMRLGG